MTKFTGALSHNTNPRLISSRYCMGVIHSPGEDNLALVLLHDGYVVDVWCDGHIF